MISREMRDTQVVAVVLAIIGVLVLFLFGFFGY